MPQHSNEKQICFIKKEKCFDYKKKDYIIYNCLKKRKITTILEGFIKNNNIQKKE